MAVSAIPLPLSTWEMTASAIEQLYGHIQGNKVTLGYSVVELHSCLARHVYRVCHEHTARETTPISPLNLL